ncbi:MAG: hypothetical protein BWY63_02508 [Chloroflexi bacterium ADurb.Bin360]|nr:MAG: hypothetical protein BWY63_02508 [Chloroflexi bacterium ADurb.Bin360]
MEFREQRRRGEVERGEDEQHGFSLPLGGRELRRSGERGGLFGKRRVEVELRGNLAHGGDWGSGERFQLRELVSAKRMRVI